MNDTIPPFAEIANYYLAKGAYYTKEYVDLRIANIYVYPKLCRKCCTSCAYYDVCVLIEWIMPLLFLLWLILHVYLRGCYE